VRKLTEEQRAAKVEYQRKWRAENPDKVKAASKRHYDRLKDDPEFQKKNRARVLAWQKANAEATNEKARAWRAENPERAREYELAKKAKDPERYRAYYRARQRRQAGTPNAHGETKHGRCENPGCTYEGALVFDHCHKTEVFRGWLCTPCNKGLGFFFDDPARLRGAAEYQQKFLDSRSAGR
jgi:hypothetical protein